MILVFSHNISPRLQYVTHFLSEYYSQSFQLTTDKQLFIAHTQVKISYSSKAISENELFMNPNGLLFQTSIEPIEITCFEHAHRYKAFFKTDDVVGFDLFAAVFYLLSRYEEYLPHKKDLYGRYAHENSIAFKNNFLHLPLVNIWLEDFRKLLIQKGASFHNKKTFSFQPTYDIDIAWSYLHKGRKRSIGGSLRSLLKGELNALNKRIKVLCGIEQDPFDVYNWLDALHEEHHVKPYYFFPLAEKTGKYDKNTSPDNKAYQQLIEKHAKKCAVGIHPSWQSGDEPHLLQKEITILENITEQKVTASRQHYIRLTIPQTYRQLIKVCITDDYSMGYGSINGFRASAAVSFYWYDLEKEVQTNLLLHPFCFMDANSFFEQKMKPDEAFQELSNYHHTVEKVNGELITIWHNPFLGTDPLFNGWKEVYEDFIRMVCAH